MIIKTQNQYVPLNHAKNLLVEFLAPRLLGDAFKAMEKGSQTPSQIFKELELLFEGIEEALGNRLETSLIRFEASATLLEISKLPEEISSASILKAKTAALQFSKAIEADQEAIDALERVFSQANSNIIVAEANASIKDLAETLQEVIYTVKDSLEKWEKERKDILTELIEDGSEETQKMIKTGLNKGIDALLKRLAIDGIIDSRLTHIDTLPGDTRNFIMAEIIK